jgi:hypothetical protein
VNESEALAYVRDMHGTVNYGVRVINDPRRPKKTTPGVQVYLRDVDTFGAARSLERAVELARDAAQRKVLALAERVQA